jgi:hypothetical protein
MIEASINWIVENYIPALLAPATIAILGWLFRRPLRNFFIQLFYWARNEDIYAQLTHINKYKSVPNTDLNPHIFKKIQSQAATDIHSPEYGENILRIQTDDIPTKLVIRLEKVRNYNHPGPGIEPSDDKDSTVTGYKIIVDTDSQLRFGYQTDEALEEFQNLSETVSSVVGTSCFPGESPTSSYIIGRITRGTPPGTHTIDDASLGFKANLQDSGLQLRISNPEYLTKGIRKHFRPF